MIYLIDDKKIRQENYGWTDEKFNEYSGFIIPIHKYEEIDEKNLSNEIFSDKNVILYHESFFDNTSNLSSLDNQGDFRTSLKTYTSIHAFFSGSKNTRKLDKNVAYLPVSVLYQNLETFIKKHKIGDTNLKYLLFGENYRVEEALRDKCEYELEAGKLELPVDKNKILFFRYKKINYNPFSKDICDEIILFDSFLDNEDTINEKLNIWLATEYNIIFIPLYFGSTYSDFNGLKLATHIRCTETPNKLKRIFIYGQFCSELYKNEYFDILKTKNVELIECSKKVFKHHILKNENPQLCSHELPKEIKKINLTSPQNYEDNHSIANKWAIYRWSKSIPLGAVDHEIDSIFRIVENNLYFKYLKTIYTEKDIYLFKKSDLKINFSEKFNPNVLYIDDEADKGWYEIFCTIFADINKLNFNYLDVSFKDKSQDEIIKIALKELKEREIHLVILDFRLHIIDFNTKNVQEITGYKLLQSIKKINPGIQVIIFSATNKVWNLQALQEAGANGFILKESPENSFDSQFTKQTIEKMIQTVQEKIKMIFLKTFYDNYYAVEESLSKRKNVKKSNPLPKRLIDDVLKWYKLSIDILSGNKYSDSYKVGSFILMFSVIEAISNYVIDSDNYSEDNCGDVYYIEFRSVKKRLKHFQKIDGRYHKTDNDLRLRNTHITWTQKILNTIDYIVESKMIDGKISEMIRKRNDIIHANPATGETDKIKVSYEDLIWINQEIIYKVLINI